MSAEKTIIVNIEKTNNVVQGMNFFDLIAKLLVQLNILKKLIASNCPKKSRKGP